MSLSAKNRAILSAVVAFTFYTSWTWWVNSMASDDQMLVIRSALLQGTYSALMTAGFTALVNYTLAKMKCHKRPMLGVLPPLAIQSVLVILLNVVNGTPNLWATVAPGIFFTGLYGFIYAHSILKTPEYLNNSPPSTPSKGSNLRIQSKLDSLVRLMCNRSSEELFTTTCFNALSLLSLLGIKTYIQPDLPYFDFGLLTLFLVLALPLVKHSLLKYRIRKGWFGTTDWEVRLIVEYLKTLEEKSGNNNGGGKRPFYSDEDLEDIRNEIKQLTPANVGAHNG